jgi:VWFA-related protein
MLKASGLKPTLLTLFLAGWLPLAILAQKPPSPPAAPGTPPADAPKAAGQEPAPGQGEDEEDVITLGTELLQLYVSVTDKQGRPVNNLKREHFVLREDGKPQDIAFFSAVANGVLADDPEASTEPENRLRPPAVTPEGRYFALVVDDLHIAPGNFLPLRNALLNFVEKNIVEGDHLLVLSTSGTLGFLQQMTDDRRIMRLAIERLTPRNEAVDQGSFGFGFTMTDYEAFLVERNDRQTIDFLTQLYIRSSPGTPPNQAETLVRASARSIAQRTEYLTTSTLETIRAAALALGNYPGRKNASPRHGWLYQRRIQPQRTLSHPAGT